PGGRVVRADIEQVARTRGGAGPAPQPAPAPTGPARPAPVSPPTASPTADAGALLEFRAQANHRPGADVKITVTDLLVKACATALAAHPEINVSWDETRILRYRHVSIGVAVAIEDGLIVPVIRDADRKSLTGIARESRDLAARARARQLIPDELAGGTFTISNLGMYGIRQFTAVINPPQAAILAVGEAVRQP